jgi:hypothetical protein
MLTSRGVQAPTNSWPTTSILTGGEWWEEEIWVEGKFALTRRDIALAAANQDGGAHYDSRPNERTQKLRSGPAAAVEVNGRPLAGGMRNHHFPLLRQMGYEVLESRDLQDAAGGS